MSHKGEISRAERRQLAVAATSLGPWRTAALVGSGGGAVSLVFSLIGGGVGLGAVAGALSVAMTLFLIVGGAGALVSGGRADHRRIREWAAAHPWRVALVPGAAAVVGEVVIRQVLTAQDFFASLGSGLWQGLVVTGVVGLVGRIVNARGGAKGIRGA
ncbi:hypothetical protein ABT160_35560 [Streptomyces sp. NPDC001941]|uniref:hypothetical protein n=1 Tax=Streptomyces sp. NPDC001941 TaxID=3154659 RepID=UPI00331FDF8A